MPSTAQFVSLTIACGDREEAERIGRALVELRLAACVQIAPISSTYRWQDEICHEDESLISAKTAPRLLPRIEKHLVTTHSYDVPELVAQPISWTSAAYGQWLTENLAG